MHTHNLTSIPYINNSGAISRRLIVRPDEHPAVVNQHGIEIPKDANVVCETGVVISNCEGSEIPVGAHVSYRKIERNNPEERYSGIEIAGEELDLLFENEIWSVDNTPFNRLFIEPLSGKMVSDGGIIIPDETLGVPQKGIIHAVPPGSLFKVGDTVEYRKAEQGMYPTANVDGRIMEVLFERDIYSVNEKAAPHKIIVRVDINEQKRSRFEMASGLIRPEAYIHMMYNLQYAKVVSIGSEAAKMYPKLRPGCFAILHHTVEHQQYRMLREKKGKDGKSKYAYIMINCFSHDGREIFGMMESRNNLSTNPIPQLSTIKPFDRNIFLKPEIELFEKKEIPRSELHNMDYTFNDIKTLPALQNIIAEKKKEGAGKYTATFQRLSNKHRMLNPADPAQKEELQALETSIEGLKTDALEKAAYVNKNHAVICTPIKGNRKIVATFKELYPITLLGENFIIAHEHFILLKTHKDDMGNTIHTPFGDKVLILPIEDKKESHLILPEDAKERPVKGRVIRVGPGTDKIPMIVSEGNVVYFKRMAGAEIAIDGVEHLVMHQNDLLTFTEE